MKVISRYKSILFFALIPSVACAADVIWYDGIAAPKPAGALLTNNPGYWDTAIPTSVTYSYLAPPTNPGDTVPRDKTGKFGNRLLDGQTAGDWNSPVGINRQPLVVNFDYHQKVTLNEVAVAQFRDEGLHQATVEVKIDSDGPWIQTLSTRSPGKLHRLVLPSPTSARFVRLTLKAEGEITYISEVWMWGHAQAVTPPDTQSAQADKLILSPEQLAAWRERTGFNDHALTWQIVSPWHTLGSNPLDRDFLPDKSALRRPLALTATQNESESAALFLINAHNGRKDATVHLSGFIDAQGHPASGLKAQLYVAGTTNTRRWGQTFRPLISQHNKMSATFMQKYMANSKTIVDFPTLHFAPGGTAMLWLTVSSENAAPGVYTSTISDGQNQIPVRLEVLPLSVPEPNDRWVRFWGQNPASTCNLWSDPAAVQRELEYQLSMGLSVIYGWPDANTYMATARQLLESRHRRPYYRIGISADLRNEGRKLDFQAVSDEFKSNVRGEIEEMIAHAVKLKIPYDQWFVELWDEPGTSGAGSMKQWVAIASIIKELDPKVRIYMNPLFWTREGNNPAGFVNDQRQVETLGNWYNKLVDISCPILGQVDAQKYPLSNKEFYNYLPRLVRAYYIHPCPGRMLTWEAFERGYNGWGFYAYNAPRANPWDDFDGGREFDYQIVYPGPDGFIPTIESESMRESWEDYCLLTLMKERGKTAELGQIMKEYRSRFMRLPDDETPLDRDQRTQRYNDLLPRLRDQALKHLNP